MFTLGLPRVESKVSNVRLQEKALPFSGWAIFSLCHPYRTGHLLTYCLCTCLLSSSGAARGDTVIEETLKVLNNNPAMPSNPSGMRLTKKQRKATAFRERGKKSKGVQHEDTGRSNPAPGHPQRRRPSTGDNGTGNDHRDEDYREDDEDANAVPAMEDQDQALAEMARDTETLSKKPDRGRPVRVQKAAVAMGSPAAQKKRVGGRDEVKKRGRSGADDGGETRPATKKARLARGSDEVPPPLAREGDNDDEATRMSALEEGEGGRGAPDTKDEEGKLHRYILFIGMSYLLCGYDYSSEHRRESQVHHDARGNPEPLLPVRCGFSLSLSPHSF